MVLLNQKRALQVMETAGVDALLATSPGNVAYLTDAEFQSLQSHPNVNVFALLEAAAPTHPAVVIPSHEVDPWAEQPGQVDDVTVYGRVFRKLGSSELAEDDVVIREHTMKGNEHGDAIGALTSMLRRRGLDKSAIGLDETRLPGPMWQTVIEALPEATFIPASGLFQTVRMVKTGEEINRLRNSAQVTAKALEALFAASTEGHERGCR